MLPEGSVFGELGDLNPVLLKVQEFPIVCLTLCPFESNLKLMLSPTFTLKLVGENTMFPLGPTFTR